MTVLVTGAAGFIGFHVADRLLARGETVVGRIAQIRHRQVGNPPTDVETLLDIDVHGDLIAPRRVTVRIGGSARLSFSSLWAQYAACL